MEQHLEVDSRYEGVWTEECEDYDELAELSVCVVDHEERGATIAYSEQTRQLMRASKECTVKAMKTLTLTQGQTTIQPVETHLIQWQPTAQGP